MSLKKTRFPGVYRYKSRKGAKDVFRARIYDPSEESSQKWIGTFPTAREAYAAKQKAERNRDKRKDQRANPVTHNEYAETWLELHPRAQSTMNSYRNGLKRFLEEFGESELGSIERRQAREWAIRVPDPSLRAARTMLNDAIDDGLIAFNPLNKLRLPTSQGRRRQPPPSAADVLALAETAIESGHDWGPMMGNYLLFGFGSLLRPNEIGALRWEDLDFEKKTISVARGMDRRGRIGGTKTGTEGLVALTPLAEQALEDMTERCSQNDDLIFLGSRGGTLITQKADLYFRHIRSMHVAKTGEPRFHKMSLYLATRHAGATFMRNVLGIRPDDIEMQLRHSGYNLLDLYTHPSERPAIDRILALWPEDLAAFLAESRS